MNRTVRIGNSSGFWGDEPRAMERQVRLGNLDYLVADYLAEVSMSILAKQQIRNPELGYVADFIEHVALSIDPLKNHFPKMITNAGGNNTIGCAHALQQLLDQHGFDKKVFAVTGDNLLERVEELIVNNPFENLETKEDFEEIKDQLATANVYTSSEGIVAALEAGADIVVCGRASDSALTIGPLVYEFGWEKNDWDKLASAMVAGHILECGAQASGGNFTDWEKVSDWDEMGYPIIEMDHSGDFIVTKADATGGIVNQWTVKEQLVYEIANPKQYMGPDVIADLTTMQVRDIDANQVKVSNVTGHPSPSSWKVSMAYQDGYKASGMIVIGGEKAAAKAEIVSKAFWKRMDDKFAKTSANFIGANALGKSLASEGREILLQLTAFDSDKSKLIQFSKEIAGMILAGPQGMAAFGGRPKVQEVMAYWPTLVNKGDLNLQVWEVKLGRESLLIKSLTPESNDGLIPKFGNQNLSKSDSSLLKETAGKRPVLMSELCLARSGDKGNSVNLGVLARTDEIYAYLEKELSETVIKTWFDDLCEGQVIRYTLPNLNALNFMLHEALDGGGTRSGRLDPQGKMLASAFLAQKVYVPVELLID